MGINKTFISFAIVGLFIVSMISFIVQTQINNDVEETLLDNPFLNKTYIDLGSTLGDFKDTSQTQNEVQDNDNPLTEGGSLLFVSITKTGKVVKGMISGVYNVIIVLPATFFGLPEIVITVLSSILVITLIFSAWRLYKAGE